MRTSEFLPPGMLLALCLGLHPLEVASASAKGASGKQSTPPHASVDADNSCWNSHAKEIQEKTQPFASRQDSLSRQISVKHRSLLMEAMEKQGITSKLTKSQPTGGVATALQKGEEKAALEEIRALESQIRQDPGLQKLVDGLRTVERSIDSTISEILKQDTTCAGLDRAKTRGIASRAKREHHARVAEKSQKFKRKAINPGLNAGESK